MVASKNDQTGETDFKPVVQLFNFTDKVVINLTFETRQGDEELIQATPEHPFMLKNGQWKSAGQLTPGDFIKTFDNKVVRLKSVATDAKTQEVFNFEVADFHTYFVGENGVWVHNSCKQAITILHHISDIATDPKAKTGLGKWDSPYAIGTRDGIEVRVDFYPKNHKYAGKISTAYPINVKPNP